MTEPLDRRLVAVVFTDMVGYTALLQADERTALEKRDCYWAALERHHDASEGTIVQRLGDGSMSMFPVRSPPFGPRSPSSVSSRRRTFLSA